MSLHGGNIFIHNKLHNCFTFLNVKMGDKMNEFDMC